METDTVIMICPSGTFPFTSGLLVALGSSQACWTAPTSLLERGVATVKMWGLPAFQATLIPLSFPVRHDLAMIHVLHASHQ